MDLKTYRSMLSSPRKSKFNAKRCSQDGINFDSLAEMEWYNKLKIDPALEHIDVHVPVTLPGGVRYRVDFIAYFKNEIVAYEVKGKQDSDFRNKRKLFDQFHPLKPLQVWRKRGKQWTQI